MARTPRVRPNVPTPPTTNRGGGGMMFPSDLKSGGKEFYTSIGFTDYNSVTGGGGMPMGGSITLPIPRKVNETQSVIWEEVSLVGAGLAAAAGGASAFGGGGMLGAGAQIAQGAGGLANIGLGAMGYRVNPHLLMLFKQPNFKQYTFNWSLAANSKDESDSIASIIAEFKSKMLPTAGKFVYGYPLIADISLHPNDKFLTKFKPAAVMEVQVDYTGSGQPSFFYTGAPTVVNLAVTFREVELWTR